MMVKKIWRSRTGRSMLVLLGLVLLVHFLDSRGYLHGLQMVFGLDPLLRQNATPTQFDVSIVDINDEDYRDYFCGQSPLDGRAVIALVKAVRDKLQPEVIGVDLDTSDWENTVPTTCPNADKLLSPSASTEDATHIMDEEIGGLLPKSVPPEDKAACPVFSVSSLPRIVWAQIPGESREGNLPRGRFPRLHKYWKCIWKGEQEESTVLPLQKIVGRSLPLLSSGVPRFPIDPDGVVRRYRRRYWVVDDRPDSCTRGQPEEMDSLPHALARAYRAYTPDEGWQHDADQHSDEDIILQFVADPYAFRPLQAKYLLPPLKAAPNTHQPEEKNFEKARGLRPQQIVLIGGTYKGARDIYRTPLGDMPGVMLLAQAVETDLHKGFQESSDLLKISADLLAGLLVIFLWKILSQHISLSWVFFLNLVGMLCIAIIATRLFFNNRIWLDFVGVYIGVVSHQVIEEFHKIKEYEKEVKKFEGTIDANNQTIAQLKDEVESLRPPAPPPAATPYGNPREGS